jgi:drug/metabolite transporter (DMT)-like permease
MTPGIHNHPLRAGLFMIAALACFVFNDTCIKIIGTSLPLGEIMTVRGMFSVVLIAAVCMHQGVLPDSVQIFTSSVLLRSCLDVGGTFLFLICLLHMPIANLTAITQTVPLAVVALSIIFLNEKIGWRRGAAIALGFTGVLFIVKPSPQNVTLYEMLALGMVVVLAFRDLMTKRIPSHVPTLLIALANAVFVLLGGALLVFFQGFQQPQLWQVALLAMSATLLSAGYLLIVNAMRLGELSATAPFRYFTILITIVVGMAIFNEFPDELAYIGMLMVIIAGLYAAHRETRLYGTKLIQETYNEYND